MSGSPSVAAPPGRGRGTCSARYAHSRGPLIARVLGVDACSKGWVGIAHDGTRCDAYFGATIAEVVAAGQADGAFDVVAIDIPIGLPDSTSRQADELARRELGVRRAVLADDYASASRINRELTGSGISMQAFMLKPKLLEVEAWVLATTRTVIEVHPELSFTTMAGAPLPTRKATWAGAVERHRLLRSGGLTIDSELGEVGRLAGVDDVLDAGAAAWTAQRYARRVARSRPSPPERFSDGIACAIWT